MRGNLGIGWILLVAGLLAACSVIWVGVQAQLKERQTALRSQGASVAEVLAAGGWRALVSETARAGPVQNFVRQRADPDMAYAEVVDLSGRTVVFAAESDQLSAGRSQAEAAQPVRGERQFTRAADGRTYLEFHAPIFNGANLAGEVRVAYLKPMPTLDGAMIGRAVILGLPIALLILFMLFVSHTRGASLRKLSRDLDGILEKAGIEAPGLPAASGEHSLRPRLTQFAGLMRGRVEQLAAEHSRALTSNKLLAYKQSRIEAILEMLPEAILVIDEAGTVAYANRRVSGMLGVDRSTIMGKRPRDWCDNPNLLAYLSRRHGGHGQVGFISDAIQFVPDGKPDNVTGAKIYPLFSSQDDEKVLGDLVVVRDITEQQIAKRSRSEFVAQISHELKTPLNVLAMYSESMLGDDGNDEAFRVEAMNVIHDEVERLAGFINAMLAISQFELGSLQISRTRVRLPELLSDAFQAVAQSGKGRDLEFEIDVPREMSSLQLDKDLLRIAINNLLTNAIKYNRPGGIVKLTAEETPDAVEVRVSDTGLGISEEDQSKIFDKFYRSDDESVREQNGHGLGLSLAQQIIQLHHGSLGVESKPDEGSTFIIRLEKDTAGVRMAGMG